MDNARLANVIVQGPLLAVETGHDVADHHNHCAEPLREVAAQSDASGKRGAIRANDFESQGEFTGSGAAGGKKLDFIRGS